MKYTVSFLLLLLTLVPAYDLSKAQTTYVNLNGGYLTVDGTSPDGPNYPWYTLFTAPGYSITGVIGDDPGIHGNIYSCYETNSWCTPTEIQTYLTAEIGTFVPWGFMVVNGQGFCFGGGPSFNATSLNSSVAPSGKLTVYGNAAASGSFFENPPNCEGNLDNPIDFLFGSTQWQYQADFVPDPDYPGAYDLDTLTVASGVPIGYVAPDPLNFGLQLLSTSSSAKSVALTNRGNAQMTVSNVSVTGDFAIAYNYCINGVRPGTHCNVGIIFKPLATGQRTGTLTFVTNASNNPHIVNLIGTGTIVKLSAKALTFPTTLLGYKSAAKQIVLTNVGTTQLSIGGIAATGDFAQTNSCGASLAAGFSCAVTVTFAPTAINTRTGAITITDNGGGSPQTVALKGTGTQVQLSATSINFGKITKGTTPTKTITLTNVGTTTLSIQSFTIGGTNASDFSSPVNPPCAGSVAAGATCSITLRFSPSTVGTSEKATFWLFDDGGGSPQKVSLIGMGI